MKVNRFQIIIFILILIILAIVIPPLVEISMKKYSEINKHLNTHNEYINKRFTIICHGPGTDSGHGYNITVIKDNINSNEYLYYKEGNAGGMCELKLID